MSAVLGKTWGDLRRRKLQSIVICLVILLSSGAATLALNLLVESDAPYDHAFVAAKGAHLSMVFAANKVSAATLRGTASAHGVTAAAGPWPQVQVNLSQNGATAANANAKGQIQSFEDILTIVGRDTSGGPVDRITIESGRWARAAGEIVLSRIIADLSGLNIGDHVTAPNVPGHPSLAVVGIAVSIGRDANAWVLPRQARALITRASPLSYLMLYRVNPARTTNDLRAASNAISARVPANAVMSGSTYLDIKLNADRLTAVMIPFLLAFSLFALAAAALIISNVVTGVVIASYREIGIMKSIGFTPGQVMLVLLGQILGPALVGGLAGIALGTMGSQPFLQSTAHALQLPAPFTTAVAVILLVLAAALAIATLAALLPCWRAGRLSAVAAITQGSAPAVSRGSRFGQAMFGLPLPRAIGLGLSDSFTRPARSTMTMGAILIGVATVVFALSLHLSLGQVAQHIIRDPYVQINAFRFNGGRGGPPGATPPPVVSDRQAVALLRADPHTARFVAEAQDQVTIPGIAEPIPYYGYRGNSAWIGYALINGRWFSGSGEAVAPTRLLAQAHLHVGDTITAHFHGKAARLRLVGEILDQTDNDLLLRGDWSTLAAARPGIQPQMYEVGLKPGADAQVYARRLRDQTNDGLDAGAVESSAGNTSFLLLNGVIAGLAAVLIAIAVTGVFNTVLLSTREKVRDVAVLKAVGMAPQQVIAMVVASVALLGLIGGGLGIPAGLLLHAQILQLMGRIASGTALPAYFYDLIGHALLPLLALAGVAIAALGAWAPAQWAAVGKVAEVLQAE